MSRDLGEWLSRRRYVLGSRERLSYTDARILKEVIPDVEVYVFGSILEG